MKSDGALAALANAELAVQRDPVRIEIENRRRHATGYWHRFYAMMMLSPTLTIFEAMLSGSDVPLELLDQEWVARYGLA